MNEREWELERAWLAQVLGEAQRQHIENEQGDERLRADALENRRAFWEEVGPVSGGGEIDQLVDFMQHIDLMKRDLRDQSERRRTRIKLERMLDSPYFGRIDFKRAQGDAAKPLYIGLSNLLDARYRLLVCDWRAPAAGMFYDFEIGPASYVCPNGTVAGELTGKRQYKISRGKIEYMFDSALKIDDEMLQQMLAQNRGERMKNIVTSIQREQNRAIRNEDYRHLIVRGPAGSGKTSIALHRAAYLLYRYRDKLTARNIIIFSPNRIFNEYISGVLPELGEEDIVRTTFGEYAKSALPPGFQIESAAQMMERIFTAGDSPYGRGRAAGMRIKASEAFMRQLERFAQDFAGQERDFPALSFKGKTLFTKEELRALFVEEYGAFPLRRRLEKLGAYILARLETQEASYAHALARELRAKHPHEGKASLLRRAKAAAAREGAETRARAPEIAAFDLIDVYRRFLAGLEGFGEEFLQVRRDTLENLAAGYLAYEDQAPLIYLGGVLGGWPKTGDIRFVIVDEAQDYTPLQSKILCELFAGASITVLGDPAQATNPYMNAGDFGAFARIFSGESTLEVRLNKSYRATREIAAFTKRLVGEAERGEPFGRHGEKPEINGFPDRRAMRRAIMRDAQALVKKGFQSVAVLTRTAREAGELAEVMKGKATAILREEDEYASGLVVMPAYLAKGLEFDAVLLYEAGGGNYAREEERLLLYTACTRALHVLRLYHTGALTPLLDEK